MDFSKYKDIAPYRGADVDAAIARLLEKREYLGAFAYVIANGDFEAASSIINTIMANIRNVKSYEDFQKYVTAGVLIPAVLKKTTTDFTVSGVEKLDPSKGYLFISTHRDIILDCALLDYALKLGNKPFCEMAFGDNLIANQFIEDLFRINGGVIVRRDLPLREKYLESIKLSQYFVDVIRENNTSIWVAQKSGRSKDGIDNTQPGIIKMLYLSKRGQGCRFNELIKSMNIVPVAISYQYDPNDINKGREEVRKAEDGGKYEKRKYEDLISMVRGMRCDKGHVHVSIGEPLTEDYATPEDVAAAIDHQIHSIYRLYNTNYIAYDYLEYTDRFCSMYEDLDPEKFLSSFDHLNPSVRNYVLNAYANPVRSMLSEKE